ncbi:hypothetical protein B0J17DRAFT_676959 [Rhizoctonia solani]|nr:hypothetical protein B0J17DRAFT_676959 [Rhizoctonia solani]
MHIFSRLASFLIFIFSLGLLTLALPTVPTGNNALSTQYSKGESSVLLGLVTDLDVNIKSKVNIMLTAKSVSEVTASVEPIVIDIQACAKAIVALAPIKAGDMVEVDITATLQKLPNHPPASSKRKLRTRSTPYSLPIHHHPSGRRTLPRVSPGLVGY